MRNRELSSGDTLTEHDKAIIMVRNILSAFEEAEKKYIANGYKLDYPPPPPGPPHRRSPRKRKKAVPKVNKAEVKTNKTRKTMSNETEVKTPEVTKAEVTKAEVKTNKTRKTMSNETEVKTPEVTKAEVTKAEVKTPDVIKWNNTEGTVDSTLFERELISNGGTLEEASRVDEVRSSVAAMVVSEIYKKADDYYSKEDNKEDVTITAVDFGGETSFDAVLNRDAELVSVMTTNMSKDYNETMVELTTDKDRFTK